MIGFIWTGFNIGGVLEEDVKMNTLNRFCCGIFVEFDYSLNSVGENNLSYCIL